MKVEIRPIEQKRWHNKKGAENFTRPKKIGALVDSTTMQYCTGLTKEEAEQLGKDLKQDLSNIFDPTTPHPFWDSSLGSVKLENHTMILDTDIPLKRIQYSICKASKYVANSMKEYEEGKYPSATHVIYDEAADADAKASKIQIKNRAITESQKLSKDRKIEIILILDGKNLKGQSDNYVTVVMDTLIDKQPSEVLRYIDMEDKAQLSTHALVIECLQKSILVRNKHKIYYHEAHLGDDDIDVALYLAKDENQDLKIRLMRAVN